MSATYPLDMVRGRLTVQVWSLRFHWKNPGRRIFSFVLYAKKYYTSIWSFLKDF
jgi:hypothetical protein